MLFRWFKAHTVKGFSLHQKVPRDRPVVQALSKVVLNGAEYICRCLVGLYTHEGSGDWMGEAATGGRHRVKSTVCFCETVPR
ncbi:hypothetical protein AOLI_G00023150 [Acnodon oligacanthus]